MQKSPVVEVEAEVVVEVVTVMNVGMTVVEEGVELTKVVMMDVVVEAKMLELVDVVKLVVEAKVELQVMEVEEVEAAKLVV